MPRFFTVAITLTMLSAISSVTGCASVPYNYGQGLENDLTLELNHSEPQVERGRPIAFIDGLGHYCFSLPTKILLLSWEVDNHDISDETEEKLQQYLEANGLSNVKVRLNQYSPGSEWLRLFRNREMPGFFRYTLGIVANSFYTIFPQRIFAGFFAPFGIGDFYNPFTNTINLYSDSPAIALHEGAHAKDFACRSRGFKGWYALMGILPLAPLYQEAVSSGDTIGYLREENRTDGEKEAYRTLYPAYMSYVGGELRWITLDPWTSFALQLGAVASGHIAGNIKAALVEESEAEAASTEGGSRLLSKKSRGNFINPGFQEID